MVTDYCKCRQFWFTYLHGDGLDNDPFMGIELVVIISLLLLLLLPTRFWPLRGCIHLQRDHNIWETSEQCLTLNLVLTNWLFKDIPCWWPKNVCHQSHTLWRYCNYAVVKVLLLLLHRYMWIKNVLVMPNSTVKVIYACEQDLSCVKVNYQLFKLKAVFSLLASALHIQTNECAVTFLILLPH